MSLKSLKAFILHTQGKEPSQIPFAEITPDWLQKYENYMITELKRSRTTVSMYVRALSGIAAVALLGFVAYRFYKNTPILQPTMQTIKNLQK